MLVLCGGMYRSLSTWQYNVAGHLVERYRSGKRLGYFFTGAELKAHLERQEAQPAWVVAKAHEADPFFAELLQGDRALALYSFRDLRDVAYSLVHKANSTFEATIASTPILNQAVANYRFWTGQPHTLVQRYEHLVLEPVAGVGEIAAHLGIELAPGQAEEIAEEFSLEKNRERSRQVAEHYRSSGVDLDDPANALCRDEVSQWHWNHIRDGRVGQWRQVATPRHLAVLARLCGRWLIEQDYEKDLAWAQGALEHVLFEEYERVQSSLKELREALSGAERKFDHAQGDVARLGVQLQVAHRELEQAGLRERHLATRLGELEALGPAALRLARAFHQGASRHPRIRSVLKKGLSALRRLPVRPRKERFA